MSVVATAVFNHSIDLEAVSRLFPSAEYRCEMFPGLVFRVKKPQATLLIFGSGRMVCTGG